MFSQTTCFFKNNRENGEDRNAAERTIAELSEQDCRITVLCQSPRALSNEKAKMPACSVPLKHSDREGRRRRRWSDCRWENCEANKELQKKLSDCLSECQLLPDQWSWMIQYQQFTEDRIQKKKTSSSIYTAKALPSHNLWKTVVTH